MSLADILKYILEGLAVAVAAYFIPQTKTEPTDVLYIGLTAAATFMLLDLFAPSVGQGARQGSGLGIGLNQVGWQLGGEQQEPNEQQSPGSDENTSTNSE